MAFIEWTEKNLIGIPQVDEQHKELFDLLNRLHAAVADGKDVKILNAVLDDLIEFAVFHFSSEEVLFESCNYPRTGEHKSEHDELAEKAMDLQRKLREGGESVNEEILLFLHDWLSTHTADMDVDFANFLRDNNLVVV